MMTAGSDIRQQVEEVLAAMRPTIQQDGGDIELLAVSEDGEVKIKFLGACIDCPSRSITLQSLIDQNLRLHVPGFRAVTAADD